MVVFGGGPIGIAAALSLRAKKINRIVIVEPAHRRRSVVRGMGFDTLDPTSADFRDNLASLAGSGVQACINAAGVAPVMAQAIDILAPGGKLMVVATHLEPVPIDLNQLLMAEKTILTSIGYRDDFPNVIEQQARGAFPTSSWVETVPFDALVETGLSRLRTGEAIKTLIEVNGGYPRTISAVTSDIDVMTLQKFIRTQEKSLQEQSWPNSASVTSSLPSMRRARTPRQLSNAICNSWNT